MFGDDWRGFKRWLVVAVINYEGGLGKCTVTANCSLKRRGAVTSLRRVGQRATPTDSHAESLCQVMRRWYVPGGAYFAFAVLTERHARIDFPVHPPRRWLSSARLCGRHEAEVSLPGRRCPRPLGSPPLGVDRSLEAMPTSPAAGAGPRGRLPSVGSRPEEPRRSVQDREDAKGNTGSGSEGSGNTRFGTRTIWNGMSITSIITLSSSWVRSSTRQIDWPCRPATAFHRRVYLRPVRPARYEEASSHLSPFLDRDDQVAGSAGRLRAASEAGPPVEGMEAPAVCALGVNPDLLEKSRPP